MPSGITCRSTTSRIVTLRALNIRRQCALLNAIQTGYWLQRQTEKRKKQQNRRIAPRGSLCYSFPEFVRSSLTEVVVRNSKVKYRWRYYHLPATAKWGKTVSCSLEPSEKFNEFTSGGFLKKHAVRIRNL